MKDKDIKKIYRFDKKDKSYHVVIDLDTYRDVYSEWDYSPMSNRDLDEDLHEYLMDCSGEIGIRRDMVIDFFVPSEIVNESRESRSIQGFRQYFAYRIRKIKAERMRKIKNSIIFFIVGTALLISATFIEDIITSNYVYKILSEGLFIGGWVAIWEIFSIIFFEVNELNYKIRHFKRLQKVDIKYHQK